MPRRLARQHELFAASDDRAVIEDIRALPSDPNLRRVRVNGRTAATLNASEIESLGLRIGARWTPALAQRVQQAIRCAQAHHQAMGLLSRRMLTEKELAQRLAKRGHDEAIVRQIVRGARKAGWLNDTAFAEDLARDTTRTKPAGGRLIEERLRRRGVGDSVIAAVAQNRQRDSNDAQAAADLARRRLDTMRSLKPAAAARRIAGLLTRRGFDEEIVANAIAALQLPDSAHE